MPSRLFIAALWSPAGKGLTSWLLLVVFNRVFVTFPCGILGQAGGQAWYLLVSIPDLCRLSYFNNKWTTKILFIFSFFLVILARSNFDHYAREGHQIFLEYHSDAHVCVKINTFTVYTPLKQNKLKKEDFSFKVRFFYFYPWLPKSSCSPAPLK